jgi:hypothetical protein
VSTTPQSGVVHSNEDILRALHRHHGQPNMLAFASPTDVAAPVARAAVAPTPVAAVTGVVSVADDHTRRRTQMHHYNNVAWEAQVRERARVCVDLCVFR